VSRRAQSSDAAAARTDPLVLALVGALGLLTLAFVIAGNGDIGLAIAPLALALVVLGAVRAPLRHSLLVLGFLCLTLECPSDVPASGKWRSPLYTVGALLLNHLNVTIPVKALFFSGGDVALVLLAATWIVRRLTRSQIDVRGQVPPAPPMRSAALLCLVAVFVVWGYGLLREGADVRFSLWQVNRVIYMPCLFLLYCAGIRGPEDSRALGIALLVAALVRALLAAYVRHLFPNLDEVPHATSHADSMLFAEALLLVVVVFVERPTRRNLLVALLALPVLTWGMIANNRRLVWIELLTALPVLYLVTPSTPAKKRIARALAVALPLLTLYVAVGWNSSSRPFQPVHAIRSVMDSANDRSTLWRDLENYDLYYTIKKNPVLGTGFGHGYIELIRLPDISRAFELYRFSPHNSILGLLAFAGFFGFAALWLMIPLGVFFAVRSYRFSTDPRDRVAALVSVCIFVAYVVHCYGDLGLGTATSLFTVAPALALVAKLAVATGAWPLPSRRPVGSPADAH